LANHVITKPDRTEDDIDETEGEKIKHKEYMGSGASAGS
jgi:hypothetical protein